MSSPLTTYVSGLHPAASERRNMSTTGMKAGSSEEPITAGISIGTSLAAVEAARDALLAILAVPRGDKVVLKAMETFNRVTSVSGVNITGCTITVQAPVEGEGV